VLFKFILIQLEEIVRTWFVEAYSMRYAGCKLRMAMKETMQSAFSSLVRVERMLQPIQMPVF